MHGKPIVDIISINMSDFKFESVLMIPSVGIFDLIVCELIISDTTDVCMVDLLLSSNCFRLYLTVTARKFGFNCP